MGFDEFLGNERIVAALRGMLRRERPPSAMLFSGPQGLGKYTLARMFAQAANCQRLKDDFVLHERGRIEVKGKGIMRTWYLIGRKPTEVSSDLLADEPRTAHV